MANDNDVTGVFSNKYARLSYILLAISVTMICYRIYVVQQSYVPSVGHQHCAWVKTKTEKLQRNTTPPWFYLQGDYENTIRSGKNMYVWPAFAHKMRLGNKLFNYAATFGIAWRNRRIPIWPRNKISGQHDITKYFRLRIRSQDRRNKLLSNKFTQSLLIYAKGNGIYDRRYEHLPPRNITIGYTMASYKYFLQVEEELRFDLTFRPQILDGARRWLEEQTPTEWKDKKFVRVLIHVRRQDFTKAKFARMGWPMPTAEYFNRSMSYFTNCLELVQFVVLSDDQRWCMKHIKATNIVYAVGHTPITDMAIASFCDHAIITVGTYGWWAAWFANGVTITQKDFPLNGSAVSKDMYREDHYKPDWIGL